MLENVTLEQANSIKQEAWKLFSTGQTEAANRIAIELYESGFANGELTYLIGCCQARSNSYSKAMDYFKESLTYQDSHANLSYIYIALGASANALNQHEKAISYYREALKINPKSLDAYLGIGETCMLKGDLNQAENNYLQAITLIPGSGMPFYQLGHIEKKRNNGEQAVKYFQKAVDREPNVPDYQIWLADTLLKLELIEDAKIVSTKALKLSPHSEIALGTYSAACARLGHYNESLEAVDTALKHGYLITDVAFAFLTVCKHVSRCDEAIKYAERCLSLDGLFETTRRNLHAQLALTLDDCERYDEAWHHISECKRYKYALSDNYDSITLKVAVDTIISTFTPGTLFGLPSSKIQHEYSPIFIVGMPRSGTSLLEQILASHSDVSACGELPILNDIVNHFPSLIKSEKTWPHCINDISQEQVDFISKEYMKRLPAVKKHASFITDKMPHNFFVIGLIRLLFPGAKIIHCRRQPLDTCISIYFANFHIGHEYSGNLFDIGAHYHQYLRLMKHWRDTLSIDLFEIDYESLVTEPELKIKELLEYCGLPWEEGCLQFNKLKRNINTASYDQVRQPIYTRSINRWRNYDKYLDNLKSGLERGY